MTVAGEVRWAARRIDGVTTLVERDGSRAVRVDLVDGVVRVQVCELTASGWIRRFDTTTDTICELIEVPDLEGLDQPVSERCPGLALVALLPEAA